MNTYRILIVDDEQPIRDVLAASLTDEGYRVESANNGEKALQMITDFKPDVTLLDIWMPGRLDGVEVLQTAKKINPDLDFIIMSGHGTIETAVKTTKYGAWDFVEKPLSIEKILILIKNVIEVQKERREKKALLNKLRKNIAIIGNSEPIKTLKQNIARIAESSNWVLIEGEPGVGKELVAQNIHLLGKNASQPFVYMNARTTPIDLMEFELFGSEKNVLNSKDGITKGKLELAEEGTLYLNEISSFNLQLQKKLLEILQTNSFVRVGGSSLISAKLRIIAASSVPLKPLIERGEFLAALYQRLTTVPLIIPPLRERKEDIALLSVHFSNFFARENGTTIKEFESEVITQFAKYDWPGNIRELKNFVERLYILNSSNIIGPESLELSGFLMAEDEESDPLNISTLKMARAIFEKQFIIKKLSENNGNVTKTADQIGIERSHLHRKIKGYGIETKDTYQ